MEYFSTFVYFKTIPLVKIKFVHVVSDFMCVVVFDAVDISQ